MDRDQRVGDYVVSQLLLGLRMLVEEVRADGWIRVVAEGSKVVHLHDRIRTG